MRMANTVTGVLLLLLVSLVSCDSKTSGGNFEVKVVYTNADKLLPDENRKIVLEEIPFGADGVPVALDSVSIKEANGTVLLKGKAKEEGVYQIAVDNGPVLLVVNDASEIDVELDMSKKDNYYTVKGSVGSQQIQDLIQDYSERSLKINEVFTSLDSMKQQPGSDSLVLQLTNEKNNQITALTDYVKDFINKAESPSVSLFALGLASQIVPRNEFDVVLNNTVKKFPEYKTLQTLKTTFDQQKAQMAEMEKQQSSKSLIGKPAPALTMAGVDGKNISIADFKGKYVLVDFWASWCGPCRKENPNVVQAFEKFKSKNFTILGVSLDKEKTDWVEAIKADQLNWSHMSDLKFWDSESVSVFGFNGIPYNVLIDPQGIIIAENLRGFDLDNKLSQVLN